MKERKKRQKKNNTLNNRKKSIQHRKWVWRVKEPVWPPIAYAHRDRVCTLVFPYSTPFVEFCSHSSRCIRHFFASAVNDLDCLEERQRSIQNKIVHTIVLRIHIRPPHDHMWIYTMHGLLRTQISMTRAFFGFLYLFHFDKRDWNIFGIHCISRGHLVWSTSFDVYIRHLCECLLWSINDLIFKLGIYGSGNTV